MDCEKCKVIEKRIQNLRDWIDRLEKEIKVKPERKPLTGGEPL